jgi:glycogen synthase kinase 3 beta
MTLVPTNAGAAVAAEQNAKKSSRQSLSYSAERIVGNGSFGVVYQATVIETNEVVAIKKVLQDRRYKNREFDIMSMLKHPNVVTLKHSFYSPNEKGDVFLNLVMEYIPETVYRTLRTHTKARRVVPLIYTKCYMYQICRSLAYIHSLGICHRDIKPQNLLLNSRTHEVKLCDFGSAKLLVKDQENVSYICSRYYRAPELVFEAVHYTTMIDIWSLGCVLAELLLGHPLFPGEAGEGQRYEIMNTMGTPTREELQAMNAQIVNVRLPSITPQPWAKVFRNHAFPEEAIDLVSCLLRYDPNKRLPAFEALAHRFFDELRDPEAASIPGTNKPAPNIHNWTNEELTMMAQRKLANKLIPPHIAKHLPEAALRRAGYDFSALEGVASPAAAAASPAGGAAGAAQAVSPASGVNDAAKVAVATGAPM